MVTSCVIQGVAKSNALEKKCINGVDLKTQVKVEFSYYSFQFLSYAPIYFS
jgi:hypothetical protein